MTVFSKLAGTSTEPPTGKRKIVPPIPLERPEVKDLQKGQYHTYKLRSNPTDAASPTYDLSVPFFREGTCEEFLLFLRNLSRVIEGQGIANAANRVGLVRKLLQGSLLTAFNNVIASSVTAETPLSDDIYDNALAAAKALVFPKRAAITQKRFMRRFLRKPATMTTREYVDRVTEINSYLVEFPPITEDGTNPEVLPNDEIMDILEFGVPNSWQKTMVLQDFDPVQKSVPEFTAFCERIEQLEDHSQARPNKESKGNSNKRKRDGDRSSGKDRKSNSKSCMLHGDNCGHDTSECKVLQSQAKKMRQNYDAQSPDKKREFKRKQELNATISAAVEAALNSRKKRKRATDDKSKELNAFEGLSISSSEDDVKSINSASSGETI